MLATHHTKKLECSMLNKFQGDILKKFPCYKKIKVVWTSYPPRFENLKRKHTEKPLSNHWIVIGCLL